MDREAIARLRLPSADDVDTLDKLVARVNFYESSVEQLKKELPKYLQQQSELEKCHSSLSKVLKAIASSEPHNLLQYFLFSYAQKEEELSSIQQELYTNLLPVSKEIMDNWSKKLISPIRDVIEDHIVYNKNNSTARDNQTTPPPNNNNNNNPPSSSTANPNVASSISTEPNNLQLLKSILPIHAKLFEKHRIQESKQLFKLLLLREIQYHAVALESYSQLLECLSEIEEQELIHWNHYYSNANIPPPPVPPLTSTASQSTTMK